MPILRDANGRLLPGTDSPNPSGRPTLNVSLSKLFRDRLESNDGTAQGIVQAWIDKCILERDIQAIKEALDRTEGKVAEKHLNVGIVAHISEEYTLEVLKAMNLVEQERQTRLELAEHATK